MDELNLEQDMSVNNFHPNYEKKNNKKKFNNAKLENIAVIEPTEIQEEKKVEINVVPVKKNKGTIIRKLRFSVVVKLEDGKEKTIEGFNDHEVGEVVEF